MIPIYSHKQYISILSMAFRRTLAPRLISISRISHQNLTNCRIPPSSAHRITRYPDKDAMDPGDDSILRRFLRRLPLYKSSASVPELRSPMELIEKFGGMDIARDRIRLDGLMRPVTEEETPEGKLAAEDVRKLLKVMQVEMVKSKLMKMEKLSISYMEYIEICVDGCWSEDQGMEFAKMLDESGTVIVLGSVVFLRPHQTIPSTFVKKLKGKLPRSPVFKTAYGRSWNVKIKEVDEKYCFVNGWHQFVNHHDLVAGDFLVFWLIDHSTFKVSIYGPNCCEKELHAPLDAVKTEPVEVEPLGIMIPSSYTDNSRGGANSMNNQEPIMEIESNNGYDDDHKACSSHKTEDPYFISVLTKRDINNMSLPKRFVRETGVGRKRKEGVRVRDEKGRVWVAGLTVTSRSRVYLTHGWKSLQRANNLKVGETCLFKFDEDEDGGVIEVVTIKRCQNEQDEDKHDAPIQLLSTIKRKRGRPRKNN